MRYAFKSGSSFSGVLGCPGLGGVGVLVSDDGEWSWFLLLRFLCLPGPSKHRSGCSHSANGWITGTPMEELENVIKLKGSATL